MKLNAWVPVQHEYDIVVTTNSGYPLDQNLYQTVKGMRVAARIVRTGGAIILATRFEDGIPDHGKYKRLLATGRSPQGVLEMVSQPGFEEQDQWQVQLRAQIQMKADVYVYSEGLSSEQITDALLRPCSNIRELIRELSSKLGDRIGVLPEGPQSIASLP